MRTFLFSMKIDSPLARLHILTKVIAILLVSVVIVRLMDMADPDPMGTVLLTVLSLAALYFGGAMAWLFRSYLFVLFPMLGTLFVTWLIFNPDRGSRVFFEQPLYDGVLTLALSAGLAAVIITPLLTFRATGKIFWGLVGGIVLAVALNRLGLNPRLVIAQFPFYKPISLVVSDKNLIVAVTKVFGYATMVFFSLLLVMTTRDAEVIGALHQARVPYAVSFFVSVMLRSLSMAVLDYGTIRQAQIARGVDLKQKGLLGKILDLARISVPLIVTMIRRSTEVGDATMARGMTSISDNPVVYRETRPFRLVDGVLVAIFGLLAMVVFGFGVNLTRYLGIAMPAL